MEKQIRISEKQKFKNPYIWTIMILLNCYIIYGLISQVFLDKPFGNNPLPDIILIAVFIITFSILFLLYILFLEITIDNNEINIQFFPFLKKQFSFGDIKKIDIVKYNPLKDYGGWGIRYGKNGKAYTIGGNSGLRMILLNNKEYLIGINNPEKFKQLANYETN